LDTAIIVSVVIGSVVAMALVFAKTVLGVAWTDKSARRIGVSEVNNQNGVTQEYLTSGNNPKRELRSSQISNKETIDAKTAVKKVDNIDSLINKQVLTCDNVTIGKVHAAHNAMIVLKSLQDKRYEIPTYYVRQNFHNSILLDICANDLEHYNSQVIMSKQK
jgi:hypothetical protein